MIQEATSASPLRAIVAARCPRCGQGRLFKRLLELRGSCESCALDYTFIDTGDGPAVFGILILGFLALGGALILHLGYGLPLWLTYVIGGIATPILAVGMLRLLKAGLIVQQYRHKAGEARLAKD